MGRAERVFLGGGGNLPKKVRNHKKILLFHELSQESDIDRRFQSLEFMEPYQKS
jgi:hypothetical protein